MSLALFFHFCHDNLIPHDNHLLRYYYYTHFAGIENWGTERLSNMLKVLQPVKNGIRTETWTVWNQIRALIITWSIATEQGLEMNSTSVQSAVHSPRPTPDHLAQLK